MVLMGGTKRYKMRFDNGLISINNEYTFETVPMQKIDMAKLTGTRNIRVGKSEETNVRFTQYECKTWRLFYFEDSFGGRESLLFHLADVFKCPLQFVDTGMDAPSEHHRAIIGWVIEKQGEIEQLDVSARNMSAEDFKWTLDHLPVTDYFYTVNEPYPSIEYQFKTFSKCITLTGALWFTLDNLLEAAKCCLDISLWITTLSNKEIDVFLNAWIAGRFPNLQFLHVISENFNKTDTILGRDPTQLKTEEGGSSRQKTVLEHDVEISDGIPIQSENESKEVEIKMEFNSFGYEFFLYVL